MKRIIRFIQELLHRGDCDYCVDGEEGQIKKSRMVRDITELRDWPENRIRNAIWNLSNCMCPGHGGPTDAEEYRRELRARGLDDRGHHNT